MATVIRGPLWADLAGAWPETPWLLVQAARPRPAISASTTTLTERPALPPRGALLRERLQSFLGALPQMVCAITRRLRTFRGYAIDRSTGTVSCKPSGARHRRGPRAGRRGREVERDRRGPGPDEGIHRPGRGGHHDRRPAHAGRTGRHIREGNLRRSG